MIRFSKILFNEGINSIKSYISLIPQNEICNIQDFFKITSRTFEELIVNNKENTYKRIYQIIKELTNDFLLNKNEKRIIFLLVGYYIFLSEFFPNRNERETLDYFVNKLLTKNNIDYLIYFESGYILAGCSYVLLDYKNKKVIWNTYTFVVSNSRGKGILKKLYNYLEDKIDTFIVIEVENPYYFIDINKIRNLFSGRYYPIIKRDWNHIAGKGNDIDLFSRLLIWSRMGFVLPIFKIKKGNLKYNSTYKYRQPVSGKNITFHEGLVLLFKFKNNKSNMTYLDILEIENMIHLEYGLQSYSKERDRMIKFISIHNKDYKFNSLAMASLRGTLI